jgi:hypothetical protein
METGHPVFVYPWAEVLLHVFKTVTMKTYNENSYDKDFW